jgi:CRISPR type III-B/RAMP module RAMP protein Cmr1
MLGGAIPKGQESWAEIRVPSLRGQLRWWFRALGGSATNEDQLFGTCTGDRGVASAVTIRILGISSAAGVGHRSLPQNTVFRPPRTARDIGCEDMSEAGYLAFNIRTPEDARAQVPSRTRFVVQLSSQRLRQVEFHHLCQVFRMFARYGSVGARSRRTFGSLRLLEDRGDLPPEAPSWDSFPTRRLDWFVIEGGPWETEKELRTFAGRWLKLHRNSEAIPKHRRGEVFGHSGSDCPRGESRRASPVILRPVLTPEGRYSLGIIVPRPMPALIRLAVL